jgi:hypothetical protein
MVQHVFSHPEEVAKSSIEKEKKEKTGGRGCGEHIAISRILILQGQKFSSIGIWEAFALQHPLLVIYLVFEASSPASGTLSPPPISALNSAILFPSFIISGTYE